MGHFLDDVTTGDLINAGLLLVAVLTLVWTAFSTQQQARASDFSSYLQLTERYANAWRKFRDSEEGPSKDFELVELLNLIEGTCHLYNEKAIHGATRDMISDYLKEVLPTIFSNQHASALIAKSVSGPDTYLHIRRFARTHGLEGVPHQ